MDNLLSQCHRELEETKATLNILYFINIQYYKKNSTSKPFLGNTSVKNLGMNS
jgi:hypothetical protein